MRLNFFPALILVTGSVYFFCCFLFSLIDGTFFICSVVNHSFSTVFVCPPGFTWYSYTISLFFDLAGGLLFTFFALFVFVTYLLAFYFFRKGKQQMEIESQIAGDSRSKKSLVLFSIVFYLSPFLITGFLFASLGISGKNESEKNSRSFNETQLDIHKATSEENIKYTEIAKNSKDLCPTSSEDIYITEPYKNDNGALHIPLGSINGIGAVFVSRENDWDGTTTSSGNQPRREHMELSPKYVMEYHDQIIDFSTTDLIFLRGRPGSSIGGYPIGSTYDVRIVLFDKDMLTVKDEYLLNPNSPYFFLDFYGDSWRPKDFYKNIKNMYPNAVLPDFTIPVVFSPVFKNNETCVTVKAR